MRASRPRSRTSYGHRSRASSPSSRRPRFRGGRPGARRPGARRDRPDHRAHRRGALPQRARVGRTRRRTRRDAGEPVLEEALDELAERAARAGVELRLECDDDVELAIRPRMLRVIARNLAENAIRYAGPGATFTLAVERDGDTVVLSGRRRHRHRRGRAAAPLRALLPRRPRACSRGTGLGLAIVKHIVTQAGGTVEARGARGRGLEVRCELPAP